jgi:hypothetical protein
MTFSLLYQYLMSLPPVMLKRTFTVESFLFIINFLYADVLLYVYYKQRVSMYYKTCACVCVCCCNDAILSSFNGIRNAIKSDNKSYGFSTINERSCAYDFVGDISYSDSLMSN